jgi:hypothetical protein
VEYGGVIYKIIDGVTVTYGYSLFRGDNTGITFSYETSTDVVDWWHTHTGSEEESALYRANQTNVWLSNKPGQDMDQLQTLKDHLHFVPGSYLRTPFGEVRFFPDALADPRNYRVVPGDN